MAEDIQLEAELRRLKNAPRPDEKPGGAGTVRFVAQCPHGASDILAKVTSLLKTIDEVALNGWPTDEQWAVKLPEWFTSACAPPMTQEKAERWLAWWKGLPPDEQARAEIEKDWSLDSWLYWMEPNNRQWFWWDAKALDDCDHILVAIEVEAWPFPWGSLRWMFKAAGASALEPEEAGSKRRIKPT
jgi:hypothetical protein